MTLDGSTVDPVDVLLRSLETARTPEEIEPLLDALAEFGVEEVRIVHMASEAGVDVSAFAVPPAEVDLPAQR